MIALAILLSLGTWQLQRLAWKRDLLARIASAKASAPVALSAATQAGGGDLEWTRISVECGPARQPSFIRRSLSEGQIVWRAMTACGVGQDWLWIDRGIVKVATGELTAPAYDIPPPRRVTGVVRSLSDLTTGAPSPAIPGEGLGARYAIAVDAEQPQPAGVTPAPTPAQISNNHLGYAITWYGLAAALAGVYAAHLISARRRRAAPPPSPS